MRCVYCRKMVEGFERYNGPIFCDDCLETYLRHEKWRDRITWGILGAVCIWALSRWLTT